MEALLLAPFDQVEIELRRACNELVSGETAVPEGICQEAKRIWSALRWMQAEGAEGEATKEVQELAQAWSLLLSKVQAVALDRAGVPHPGIMIPITDGQRSFWHHFAAAVEFLPEQDLEEDVLLAISEEWTSTATIGEALRALVDLQCLQTPTPPKALTVCVLGPSPSLEYQKGLEDLHHKLLACLFGLEALEHPSPSQPSLRLVFCGPDVPDTIHATDWKCGQLHVEHFQRCWHDLRKSGLETVDLVIALNAGTSVAQYRDLWLPTLTALAKLEHCLLWLTGYTVPEAEETWKDVKKSCPRAVALHCGPARSSTLMGMDRIELGVTPCSYPGKANYAVCAAWLPGSVFKMTGCM